ncbi:MAG: Flagellar hook-basal body complex protein FliE [Pseudomonadota bacterium]|jgi:flagellar hook-basal body complex protein FliE
MIDKTHAAGIENMLAMIRNYQAQAASGSADPVARALPTEGPARPGFTQAVKDAVSSVNTAQVNSRATAEAYERGAEIPLADVVLGMQKASVAFEATLQIRNKVLKAYEDIMNMPV